LVWKSLKTVAEELEARILLALELLLLLLFGISPLLLSVVYRY
jgi:hypothetical protein